MPIGSVVVNDDLVLRVGRNKASLSPSQAFILAEQLIRGATRAIISMLPRFGPKSAATRNSRGARRRPLFQADFRRRGGRHASWLAGASSLLCY